MAGNEAGGVELVVEAVDIVNMDVPAVRSCAIGLNCLCSIESNGYIERFTRDRSSPLRDRS